MGRSPCCDGSGIKTGHWTPEEDQKLINYIQKNGHGSWRALPKLAGLNRCGKSCRLRWINYLRSDIKRGKFSPEEEQAILHLHSILGNKWSAISTHLPGRTDNEIKNFWNTRLKKKLIHMGIDPTTHKPRTDLFATLPQLMALAGLRGMVEQYRAWDDHAARLQAEALRLAKLQCFPGLLQFPATLSNTNTDISSIFNAQVPPSTVTSGPFPGLLPAAATGPRVEISCGFEQSLGNYMLQDLISPMVNQEESSALSAAVPLPSSSSLPGVANDPLGNEDNCLTSSYGGSVASPNLWSGILDYSLVTELI